MGLINKKIQIKTPIRYMPETKVELRSIIIYLLQKGHTNLNCIDVSKIIDMGWLFSDVNENVPVKDIDISEWDVSNVKYMSYMFDECKEFNSDISKWDVSNVIAMSNIFNGCNSLTKIPAWYNGTN